MDDLHSIAAAFKGPDSPFSPRQGVVVYEYAYFRGGRRVAITIGGSTTWIWDVRYLSSYSPVVGDTVWVLANGRDMWVLGTLTPGAWPAWTPAFTGGGWALGNGTITGAYGLIGKTVHYRGRLTFGTTSTFGTSSPSISLPFPRVTGWAGAGEVIGLRMGVDGYRMFGYFGYETNVTSFVVYAGGANGAFANVASTFPATWAAGDTWDFNGTYEAA